MTRTVCLPLAALLLFFQMSSAVGAESKELRKQRQEAQRERQTQKNERNKANNEATRAFRDYVRDLKTQYQEQVKALDIEFELRRVELKADHDARVARAEAEYQKKLSSLFMTPGTEVKEQTIEQLQADGKKYADELFALRKRAAEELHRESIAKEERESVLLAERDQMAMQEAADLGLTQRYAPILATPLGDGFTKQEERWTEQEKKEVAKLEQRNSKLLGEFRNGESLRKWEIENLNEDFKLTWDEKAKLHELDSEQIFYNTMFMQVGAGQQFDQQEFMAKLAEINEQKKLIKIETRKTNDKNKIKRREQRKKILDAD